MATETASRTLNLNTPTGLAVELRLGEYCGSAGLQYGMIPARKIQGLASGFHADPRTLPNGVAITHSFRIGSAMIGLGADQAAKVTEALATMQAEIDATPERQVQLLRETRQRLVRGLNAALGAADDERAARWERGDERGGVTENRYDREAEDCRAQLVAFDVEHPEVLAAIKTANALTPEQILGL